jgi:hypothetical protein
MLYPARRVHRGAVRQLQRRHVRVDDAAVVCPAPPACTSRPRPPVIAAPHPFTGVFSATLGAPVSSSSRQAATLTFWYAVDVADARVAPHLVPRGGGGRGRPVARRGAAWRRGAGQPLRRRLWGEPSADRDAATEPPDRRSVRLPRAQRDARAAAARALDDATPTRAAAAPTVTARCWYAAAPTVGGARPRAAAGGSARGPRVHRASSTLELHPTVPVCCCAGSARGTPLLARRSRGAVVDVAPGARSSGSPIRRPAVEKNHGAPPH